jgi:serine phosphatase RsbU (regulator of sigma subunit)
MDRVLQNLLGLYLGLVFINVILSAALWRQSRNALYRALFFVWASTAVSFIAQGLLTRNDLEITIGFATAFAVNLSLAHLVALATGAPLRGRLLVAVLAGAVAVSAVGWRLGASFTLMALPVALAVALPASITAIRVLATRWRWLTVSSRALTVSSLLFSAHNVDFAFLRNKPTFAPLGFTVAILIIFALSVTAPAVALELVTKREARIATEMEAARRIQTRMVPRDTSLPGLELLSHVRPAETVGGDYLDLYEIGGDSWILLGDVTGHGLGAGLVMLMAQSTISSILHTRPDIEPRELNWLANGILHSNLRRLQESRHMTVVSLRRTAGNVFTVCGAHDDIYIIRTGGEVERQSVAHFPMGLGFLEQLPLAAIAQDTFTLQAGDLLFVGTDGVTEAAPAGDPLRGVFGEDALLTLLKAYAGAPLAEIRDALVAKLDAFTGGVYEDDVAFLVVRAKEIAA